MDMAERDAARVNYSGPAPILLAGSSEQAINRARSTLEQSGLRIAAAVPIARAAERLREQAALSTLWIELDDEPGDGLEPLLILAAREAGDGRYSAVVSAQSAMVDPLVAAIGDEPVEILIDASDMERAAALAVAMSRRSHPVRLSDVASDRSAEQLRKLSEEVNRIATLLARLSTGPDRSPEPVMTAKRGTTRRSPSRPCARSFARAGSATASSAMACLRTPPGTCCSTCSRLSCRTCACRFRACASRPPSLPRPRSAGSRRWRRGTVRASLRSA